MDITLQIMIKAPTHSLARNPAMEMRRFKDGDIIGVYLRSKVTKSPSPNSPLGFIHITGVPITALRKAKRLMEMQVNPFDPSDIWKKRVWNIDPSTLPLAIKQTIKKNREITVSWTQVKNYLKNKVTNSLVKDNDLN